MSYQLKTYSNGRVVGSGEFDTQYEAAIAANDSMATGACDEYEVTTDVEGREWVVAYGMDEGAAQRNMRADEVVR